MARGGESASKSQTIALPLQPAPANCLPSGEKPSDHTGFSVDSVFKRAPLAVLQRVMPVADPAMASVFPSGENAGARPGWIKVSSFFRSRQFHSDTGPHCSK